MKGGVPIPERMRHRPVDRRGYPVPVIAAIKDGEPLFAVNDMDITTRMIRQDRCTICGGKLFRGRWLVGGGLSALGFNGKFADAPAHGECTHYALQVCPYLAAPNWRTPIGKLQAAKANIEMAFDLADQIDVADTNRPEAFVAIMASKIDIEMQGLGVVLCRPRIGHVQRAEVWRKGEQLSGDDLADFRERARRHVEAVDTAIRPDIWALLGGENFRRGVGHQRKEKGHASNFDCP